MIKPNPCKCGNKSPVVVGYPPVGFLVDCLYCNRYTRPHNTEKGAIQKWNDLYGVKHETNL